MGGVAGHLSHLQENLGLTFGELKSVLQRVASADIEAFEKVDGQNLFFTYDVGSGQLKAARNAGDIKTGGMDADAFAKKWVNHPAKGAFLNGFNAINRAIARLPDDARASIFGPDGNNYVNAEIMYPQNPNIINYNADYIVMHNLHQFDREGKPTGITSRGPFVDLVNAVEDIEGQLDEQAWRVSGPQLVELRDISDGTAFQDFVADITRVAPGASDSTSLADYVEDRLRMGPVGDLPVPVHKQEKLIKRIIGVVAGKPESELESVHALKKGEPPDVQKQISSLSTKTNAKKTVGSMLGPIERAISDFAIEVLRGLTSFFVTEHDEETARIRKELEDSIAKLESYEGDDAEKLGEMMDKQLSKLGEFENIASDMEGIVFEHPAGSEKLYKLTGSFAMVNQIVGRARRLPSKESQQKEALLRTYIRNMILVG